MTVFELYENLSGLVAKGFGDIPVKVQIAGAKNEPPILIIDEEKQAELGTESYSLEELCHIWLRGCPNSSPGNPGECGGCTDAFLKALAEKMGSMQEKDRVLRIGWDHPFLRRVAVCGRPVIKEGPRRYFKITQSEKTSCISHLEYLCWEHYFNFLGSIRRAADEYEHTGESGIDFSLCDLVAECASSTK